MKSLFVILFIVFEINLIYCKYVAVPSGFTHDSCVHPVDDDSFISYDENNNLMVTSKKTGNSVRIPRCRFEFDRSSKPAHGPAWKTAAQYENPSSITYLYGEWSVPPYPTTQSDQILYFWNGVEPEDNSAVVQPVLQWGATPAGGGLTGEWQVGM